MQSILQPVAATYQYFSDDCVIIVMDVVVVVVLLQWLQKRSLCSSGCTMYSSFY